MPQDRSHAPAQTPTVQLALPGLRATKEREASSPPFHCETAFAWPWPPCAPRSAQSSDCGEPAGSRQRSGDPSARGSWFRWSHPPSMSPARKPGGGPTPNMRLGPVHTKSVHRSCRSKTHELGPSGLGIRVTFRAGLKASCACLGAQPRRQPESRFGSQIAPKGSPNWSLVGCEQQ